MAMDALLAVLPQRMFTCHRLAAVISVACCVARQRENARGRGPRGQRAIPVGTPMTESSRKRGRLAIHPECVRCREGRYNVNLLAQLGPLRKRPLVLNLAAPLLGKMASYGNTRGAAVPRPWMLP
ncbi:MAG TPA: hypothetical protein VMD08_11050 [Candidatus Baltobacteraceae bacterium]|nr:hypothetical protein [Candidatus Baltobacteraceae bacterium]